MEKCLLSGPKNVRSSSVQAEESMSGILRVVMKKGLKDLSNMEIYFYTFVSDSPENTTSLDFQKTWQTSADMFLTELPEWPWQRGPLIQNNGAQLTALCFPDSREHRTEAVRKLP